MSQLNLHETLCAQCLWTSSSYSLSDGQSRYEKGVLTKVKTKGRIAELYEVIGFYSYIGADQKVYTVDYTAGANGFKATHTSITEIRQKNCQILILTCFIVALKALTPTLSKSVRNVIRTL